MHPSTPDGRLAVFADSDPSLGRYSNYLPSHLDKLYHEAITNPELVDMRDHIALLEARIKGILAQTRDVGTVPHWGDLRETWNTALTAILTGDPDQRMEAIGRMETLLDAGAAWDQAWNQILETMEQLRKVTDTEVKRKKELNLMVPIERVLILMTALGTAVKRHVKDPDQVMAVLRELAMLTGNGDRGPEGQKLAGPEVVDVKPESRGVFGGRHPTSLVPYTDPKPGPDPKPRVRKPQNRPMKPIHTDANA